MAINVYIYGNSRDVCFTFTYFTEQLYDNYYKNPGMVFRARRGSASIAPLLGGGSARRRRGIIWECCTNKCSLNYIRNNYCAQGPTGEGGLGAAAWQLVDERR
jgi:hypothetical protein